MKATLRKMGNAQGVLLPKAVIARLGIDKEMQMSVENNAIVLRKADKIVRHGWNEASKKIAAAGDDVLVWPGIGNIDDAKLIW